MILLLKNPKINRQISVITTEIFKPCTESLTKKYGLPEIARDIISRCREDFYCFYEEKDSIGKRYRRMDALGTPFCVTVDHQTKEDNTVTIRYRDTMLQERIHIDAINKMVLGEVRLKR